MLHFTKEPGLLPAALFPPLTPPTFLSPLLSFSDIAHYISMAVSLWEHTHTWPIGAVTHKGGVGGWAKGLTGGSGLLLNRQALQCMAL